MNIPTTGTSALFRNSTAACDNAVGAQAAKRLPTSAQLRPGPWRRDLGPQRRMSHTEFRKVVLRGLPDPVDFGRDGEARLKRGVSLDRLISAVGGSP
jgi:hypothetical protein